MAMCQNCFQTSLVCHVPPGAFAPPPVVNSTVLNFERRSSPFIPLEHIAELEKFLRLLFGQRRKQVMKVLRGRFTPVAIQAALNELGINPDARAETFSKEIVYTLFKKLVWELK